MVKVENNTETKYVYGLGLIGEEVSGSFKVYHFDYRGSTVAITDSNCNITDTFEYDTYGKLTARTGTTKTPFLYNGRDGVMYEEDTGLIYMRARYYCPTLRRFVNADKLHGDISNALTLNRYAFVNGNPAVNVDPEGLKGIDARGGTNNYTTSYFEVQHYYSCRLHDEEEKTVSLKILPNGWYDNTDNAAYAFGTENIEGSAIEKKERTAMIYSKVFYYFNGEYYTITDIVKKHQSGEIKSMSEFFKGSSKTRFYQLGKIRKGNNTSVAPILDIGYGQLEAVVHTHGSYKYEYGSGNDNFSEEDMIVSDNFGVPIYLASNGGFLKRYFAGEPIITLADDLPYDIHHPDKQPWR